MFGGFYNIEEDNRGNGYRNDLHIIDKDYFNVYGFTQDIKLLFIMMNPGESTPFSTNFQIPYFIREQISMGRHCLNIIPTKPDRTQYQIMRIMNGLGIKYSRVINISDIRNTQSNSLSVDLESGTSDLHSIFSEDRRQELQNVYSSLADDAFIFFAWGRDIIDCEPFKQLVERCISTLPEEKVVLGIPGESYLKFKHPWPRGRGGSAREWLKEAENCFNEYFTSQS